MWEILAGLLQVFAQRCSIPGTLLGVALGLLSVVAHDERVRFVSLGTLGINLGAAIGGILQPPHTSYTANITEFFPALTLGYTSILAGSKTYRRRSKHTRVPFFFALLTEGERRKILDNSPFLAGELTLTPRPLSGYACVVNFQVENRTRSFLDDLEAILTFGENPLEEMATGMDRSRLPDLAPGGSLCDTLQIGVGRKIEGRTATLALRRRGVTVAKGSWVLRRGAHPTAIPLETDGPQSEERIPHG